jgi:hypothetical protein
MVGRWLMEAALRLGADNQIVLLLLIETKRVLGSAITGTLCVAVQACYADDADGGLHNVQTK